MSKLLGIVGKNSCERIEVRTAEYQGHQFVDVRTYWRSGDEDEWRQSKKGVTLRPELVGELITALKRVENKGRA